MLITSRYEPIMCTREITKEWFAASWPRAPYSLSLSLSLSLSIHSLPLGKAQDCYHKAIESDLFPSEKEPLENYLDEVMQLQNT